MHKLLMKNCNFFHARKKNMIDSGGGEKPILVPIVNKLL